MKLTRCTKCLMPTTRPDTAFTNGVCSACITYEANKVVDWLRRKDDLTALIEKQKPNGSGFDCVVASSGGKDSYAQILDLLDMGIRPLAVTATTCMLTELGRENIDNLKRYVTTIEVSPNSEVRAKLNYLGLSLVGDISWPEHVAIFTTPMRIAVALGIPLVFYGENPQAQYGGPNGTASAVQMTRRWVSEFGGFLGLRPVDMVGQVGITAKDMQDYLFPDDSAIRRVKCQAHFLGQYLGPWDSHRNASRAIKAGLQWEIPSRSNWWPWENLDNAMTGLHDYVMYKKYGYGRACAQLSVDIRAGLINRESALHILAKKEGLFPSTYAGFSVWEVYRKLGITHEDFENIVDKFAIEYEE